MKPEQKFTEARFSWICQKWPDAKPARDKIPCIPINTMHHDAITQYTAVHKKRGSKLFATTFANIDRFG